MVIRCIDAIFMFASYPSAAFLSCERFYALYWPFKHRLLSTKKYRIAIFILWIFTASLSTILTLLLVFSSFESALYVAVLLGPAIFICVFYIEIWIKPQHDSVFSQHPNKASRSRPFTKTLLFVSILALLYVGFPLSP